MMERAARDHILFANRGTCSIGPEMVLEEVGFPFQLVPVNTRENQSRTADYLKINPAGQVPCLVFPDGRKIAESAAIMLTLQKHSPDHPFASAWCDDRMPAVLRWLFFLSGSMTRGYSLSGRPDKFVSDTHCQSSLAKAAKEQLGGLWDIVEGALEGDTFFREGYSIVDVFIAMQLLWDAGRASLLSTRPRLSNLFHAVTARPAIAKVVERHSSADFWRYDSVNLPQLASELSR